MKLMKQFSALRRRLLPPSRSALDRKTTALEEKICNAEKKIENLHCLHRDMEAKLLIASTEYLLDNSNEAKQLPNSDALPMFNPSFVEDGEEGYLFCVRRSTLLTRLDGQYSYKYGCAHNTRNVLQYTDAHFEVWKQAELDDSLLRQACDNAKNGIEDIRLFRWKGALFGLGTGVTEHSGDLQVTQILMRIEQDAVVEFWCFPSPLDSRWEKNWVPLIHDDRLFIVYSIRPLIIYEFEGGSLSLATRSLPAQANFHVRGGTSFVPVGNNYVALAHLSPVKISGKSYYQHVFVALDAALDLIEVSEPFFIQRKGIEFACGLSFSKGNFFISYGVGDRSARICRVSLQQSQRYLAS